VNKARVVSSHSTNARTQKQCLRTYILHFLLSIGHWASACFFLKRRQLREDDAAKCNKKCLFSPFHNLPFVGPLSLFSSRFCHKSNLRCLCLKLRNFLVKRMQQNCAVFSLRKLGLSPPRVMSVVVGSDQKQVKSVSAAFTCVCVPERSGFGRMKLSRPEKQTRVSVCVWPEADIAAVAYRVSRNKASGG
jgi:hypothetical protein